MTLLTSITRYYVCDVCACRWQAVADEDDAPHRYGLPMGRR